ncbi:MAG TPA: hypothetical protein VFQ67_04685 [Allosphingosinicella sp.]|jgi:hypothetical protein|nr:hypothetical protein [Allosphingosinicella sp.]
MILLAALLLASAPPTAADVQAVEKARVLAPLTSYTRDGKAYVEFAPTVETRNPVCTSAADGAFDCAFESRTSDAFAPETARWEPRRERLVHQNGCWRFASAAAAQPSAAPTDLPGQYRMGGEPDVASFLMLKPDGRFEYALSAGALDEYAAGTWSVDGNVVRLTTQPKPVPPEFSAASEGRTDTARLAIRIAAPGGSGIAGIDLRVGFAAGDPVESYTQEDGWELPLSEARAPLWVELSLPMYGIAPKRFAIEAERANVRSFTLVPHDLGVVDFEDVSVERVAGKIVIHRGSATQTYTRLGD